MDKHLVQLIFLIIIHSVYTLISYSWLISYSLMYIPLCSVTYPELWAQRSLGTYTCWLHRGQHESSISLSALCRCCWWAECSFSGAGHPAAWCGPCSSRARRLCVFWRQQEGRAEGTAGQSTRYRECHGTAWYQTDTWRCTGWPHRSLSWPRCPEVPKRSTGNWHLREDQRQICEIWLQNHWITACNMSTMSTIEQWRVTGMYYHWWSTAVVRAAPNTTWSLLSAGP